MDDVEEALAMGEGRVAEILLDRRLRAVKAGHPERLGVLRRRAEVAEELSIDDDLPSLAATAKRIGEAATHPDAGPADRAAWAWALLMAGSTGKARKVGTDDPLVAAGLAWATRPTSERRAALVAAAGDRLDRVVRLLVQRHADAVVEAERWLEARRAVAPPPDRHALRALRLFVEALRVTGDPRAEEAARLAPEPADPAARCRRALERIRRVEERFGDPDLTEPALWALAMDARVANEHGIAAEALERLDGILRRRGKKALQDRRSVLTDLFRSRLALGETEAAEEVVRRHEEVLGAVGQPVPDHLTRAALALARGDLDGHVAEHHAALARCEAGDPPVFGPEGSTTKLVRAWTRMAEERRARGM